MDGCSISKSFHKVSQGLRGKSEYQVCVCVWASVCKYSMCVPLYALNIYIEGVNCLLSASVKNKSQACRINNYFTSFSIL